MLPVSSNCEATVVYVIMCAVRRRLTHMCLLHIIPSPDRKQQQGSTGERQLAQGSSTCPTTANAPAWGPGRGKLASVPLGASLPGSTSLRQRPVETPSEQTSDPAPAAARGTAVEKARRCLTPDTFRKWLCLRLINSGWLPHTGTQQAMALCRSNTVDALCSLWIHAFCFSKLSVSSTPS